MTLFVDGHVYDAPGEAPLQGDGEFPPFYVFDAGLQESIAGPLPTRNAAEKLLAMLNPHRAFDPFED